MGNPVPSQTRAVDPYASYHSNVVNRLTQMVTAGRNCLFGTHAMEVAINSITQVGVTTGQCFKDNVLIEMTAGLNIDLNDSDFYVDPSSGFWNEVGYYYIVLDYQYNKSRPAPEASIKIIKPSQRVALFNTTRYVLLKVVGVSFTGVHFQADTVHDYDPSIPANSRLYVPLWAGVENSLPTFVQADHEARIIYVRDQDRLYWGTSTSWESIDTVRDNVNTVGMTIGYLGYFNGTGVSPAIADNVAHQADCVVQEVGLGTDGSGKVRIAGKANNVPVETGRTITAGNDLFLSSTEAGHVTNVQPASLAQRVGRALTSGNHTTPISIWFITGGMLGAAASQSIRATITSPGGWTLSGSLYYSDIDVSSLNNPQAVVKCYRSNYEIDPYDVQIVGSSVRIWMPVNTVTLNVVIVG